jgi:hypothetical protein
LDDLKERRGYSHLKEEALDRTIWRDGFGRGFGPVVRQTAKGMNCNSLLQINFPENTDISNLKSSHYMPTAWKKVT